MTFIFFGGVGLNHQPGNNLFCSPTGVLYLLPVGGRVIQKLVALTLQTVVAAESLPAELQFVAVGICVTKDEVWSVVWNIHIIFPETVGNVIIPIDEFIFIRYRIIF